MNLNISFKPEDLKKMLPYVWQVQPYVFGVLLILIFGFTAYEVNSALNVTASTQSTLPSSAAKINFETKADQATISSLKSLQNVQGTVSTGNLGTANPF